MRLFSFSSCKRIPPPSPHNIFIMGATFFRSLCLVTSSFHRLHCRYLFARNRPVSLLSDLKYTSKSPLENSVPIWYHSLLAAFVSPSCTNRRSLFGMSHLLSGRWTEQALCTCWYITIDQSIYTRLPEPPGGLIEPSYVMQVYKKKQPAVRFDGWSGRRQVTFLSLLSQATHDVFHSRAFPPNLDDKITIS